ncbi:phosphosulfolactate synthase [Marininema mesophilum]|uniref:Phosphosulfolactate synthase n=1 Tax=Marininema mesophilum TaxID=1048340 RepID=A0A1H2UA44_9BACL|nr:phosphosulfolactate synthase [Marininema mesophilum]SDW53062.1 phosphosulfolactate synthase [Marininema mesophilum]
MDSCMGIIWNASLKDPTHSRQSKPRTTGLTMVLDKGIGLHSFRDMLQLAGEYIDFIKLGFGTAGITPIPILQEKLLLASSYDTFLYPGGTFFEVAFIQGKTSEYFHTLKQIGFTYVEISDGTIHLSEKERCYFIEEARSHSLRVITEIGKKEEHSITPINHLVHLFHQDRACGADFVIVEGRESGYNVGIYNHHGDPNISYVDQVCERVDHTHLWWECPKTPQQIILLRLLGVNANLGNICNTEILSLESLRRGLRSDTFFTFTTPLEKDLVR